MRDMLRQLFKERGLKPGEKLTATDYMDDGTPIVLSLSIGAFSLRVVTMQNTK